MLCPTWHQAVCDVSWQFSGLLQGNMLNQLNSLSKYYFEPSNWLGWSDRMEKMKLNVLWGHYGGDAPSSPIQPGKKERKNNKTIKQ